MSRMRTPLLALVLFLGTSCSRSSAPAKAVGSAQPRKIEWIEDDPKRALSDARSAKRPLFVETWATWCHTCLSMRSFVFTDPGLLQVAERFTWLAVDADKPQNAELLAKFPVSAYPTFLVVDPALESVVARWVGSASMDQILAFLKDSERQVQLAHSAELPAGDPLALLLRGYRAVQAEKHEEAATHFAAALDAAPPGWSRRSDALIARIEALEKSGNASACVDFGLQAMEQAGRSASAVDLAFYAMECASKLQGGDPRLSVLRKLALPRVEEIAADGEAPLSADDRGEALALVMELKEQLGDKAGARAAAEKRLALLEKAAAAAPDETARSTFNWARANTYLVLEKPEEAIRMLTASEAALPRDFNPPHQLARVLFKLGRHDEAVAAVDRALAKAYGPRKGTVLGLKADILEAKGQLDLARQVIEEQVRHYQSLPDGQKRESAAETAIARLKKLGAGATP
ncbi:MAG: thioredoxin family protein [Deltaproteobacteria bacterium]|nr:thioredoxin family protein [Deltaproteobacteria bacterium]